MSKIYKFDYIKEMVDKWNPNVPRDFDSISETPFCIFIYNFTDYYGEHIDDIRDWLNQRELYIKNLVKYYKNLNLN